MNYRNLDVAGSSLTLDRFILAGDGLLALARQHDAKFVTEVVLEVY